MIFDNWQKAGTTTSTFTSTRASHQSVKCGHPTRVRHRCGNAARLRTTAATFAPEAASGRALPLQRSRQGRRVVSRVAIHFVRTMVDNLVDETSSCTANLKFAPRFALDPYTRSRSPSTAPSTSSLPNGPRTKASPCPPTSGRAAHCRRGTPAAGRWPAAPPRSRRISWRSIASRLRSWLPTLSAPNSTSAPARPGFHSPSTSGPAALAGAADVPAQQS